MCKICRTRIRWWTLKRAVVILMIAGLTMIMMMISISNTTLIHPSQDVQKEVFIPEFPNQTRIGEPADIPKRFLIEESDACVRGGGGVEVIVYVHSAISRVKQRQQTRSTWASSTAIRMVVVFMVGHAKTDEERQILRQESERYHDIVQGDYGDHYNLLSYKGLSSLYWITRHCPHVPWTLHADDDLLIDTFILRTLITQFGSTAQGRRTFHCRILKRQEVFRSGRWSVTKEEFPARHYPPFCQGPMWVLATDQIPKLLQASASAKFLWVDDAYLTGVLGRRAGLKISPIPDNRFGIGSYSGEDVGTKLMWFHIDKENMTELWSGILKHHNAAIT